MGKESSKIISRPRIDRIENTEPCDRVRCRLTTLLLMIYKDLWL
jgi:hypothetical protein